MRGMARARHSSASGLHILRRRMLKVLLTRGLTAALAGLALAPAAANAGIFFPEKGGSENADKIWTLYLLIFILAWIVFLGVAGALLWAMIKFRARPRRNMVAAQIHGNTRLEIGWTVGAFVILVFITVFTFITLPGIKNPPASDIDANGNPVTASNVLYAATDQPDPPKGSPSLNLKVDGQQYVWRYQYPKQGANPEIFSYVDMVVPVGMTVTLDITADDVIHSWWIPKLGGKMDGIPGYVNKTWFKIPESAIPEGEDQVVYHGQCAELCGRNHANMLARVIGMRYPDYQSWVQRKAQEIKTAREQAAKTREEIDKQNSTGQ
jgi:cytochrome c oxidase subunit II